MRECRGCATQPSMERCTHRLTRRLYSFCSSAMREKRRPAASRLRCVAGSGEGSAARSWMSWLTSERTVRSLGSQQCHMSTERRYGTPAGEIGPFTSSFAKGTGYDIVDWGIAGYVQYYGVFYLYH